MEGGVASNEHKYESSSESDTDGAIGGGGGDVPIPYEHACEIYRNLSKTALAKVLSTSPDLNHPSFFTSFNKRLDESLPLLNKEGGITYAELHNSVFQTTFVEAVKLGCESLKAESSKSLQQQQLYYQGGGAASKARGRASLTNTISPIISWMAKSAKADVFRPRDERLVISDEAIQNALNRNALIIKELHHIVDTHKRKLQVPSAVKDVSKEVMDRILYLQEFSKVLLTNLAELADSKNCPDVATLSEKVKLSINPADVNEYVRLTLWGTKSVEEALKVSRSVETCYLNFVPSTSTSLDVSVGETMEEESPTQNDISSVLADSEGRIAESGHNGSSERVCAEDDGRGVGGKGEDSRKLES